MKTKLMSGSLLSLMTVLTIACGDKGGDGGGGAPADSFKTNVAEEMSKTTPLTPQRKAQIKAMMKGQDSLIPHSSLIYGDYGSDEKSQKKQKEDLQKLDAEGRALLSKIQTFCNINREKTKTTGEEEPGKTLTKEKEKSVVGENCPVYLSSKSVENILTTSKETTGDPMKDDFVIRMSRNGKTTSVSVSEIIDPLLKQKVGITKTSTTTESTSVMENVKFTKKGFVEGRILSEGKSFGSATRADGAIVPISGTTEVIYRPESLKFLVLIKMDLPEGGLVIVIKAENKNEPTVIVNGEALSLAQVSEELGLSLTDFRN